MVSQPVLISAGGTLEQQLIENEVSDTPVLLPWTDSRLFHGLGEGTQHWTLDHWQFHRPQSRTFPTANCCQDSWTLRLAWRRRLIAQTDLVGRDALQMDSNLAVGEEDQRLERCPGFHSSKP